MVSDSTTFSFNVLILKKMLDKQMLMEVWWYPQRFCLVRCQLPIPFHLKKHKNFLVLVPCQLICTLAGQLTAVINYTIKMALSDFD